MLNLAAIQPLSPSSQCFPWIVGHAFVEEA